MANTTGKKFGGREPGTPNKITVAAKQAFALAFEGIGGVPFLTKWAKANPSDFLKLYARLIPVEVAGSLDAPIQLEMKQPRLDPNEMLSILRQIPAFQESATVDDSTNGNGHADH